MGSRLRIPLGSRTLDASWPLTVLTVAAVTLFLALGNWQWSKGNRKAQLAEQFAQGSQTAEPLGERRLGEVQRFQRVRVSGELDTEHQFLLDNISHNGRPGYEVLTPLDRAAGGPAVLVNRGWIPFSGHREKLPDVSFESAGTVDVSGRVDELPAYGLARGRAAPDPRAPWPKRTSFPDAQELAQALGRPVESRILLLDATEPNGYVREWQPPGVPAGRHWAYGVQWYAFAVLAAGLWLLLGMRRTS